MVSRDTTTNGTSGTAAVFLAQNFPSKLFNSSKPSKKSTLTGSYPSTASGKQYGNLRLTFPVGCYRSEIGKLRPLVWVSLPLSLARQKNLLGAGSNQKAA